MKFLVRFMVQTYFNISADFSLPLLSVATKKNSKKILTYIHTFRHSFAAFSCCSFFHLHLRNPSDNFSFDLVEMQRKHIKTKSRRCGWTLNKTTTINIRRYHNKIYIIRVSKMQCAKPFVAHRFLNGIPHRRHHHHRISFVFVIFIIGNVAA